MRLKKKWVEQVLSASVWAHISHAPVSWLDEDWSNEMKPLSRGTVNKGKSARRFRKAAKMTKAANMAAPMRGGIRL